MKNYYLKPFSPHLLIYKNQLFSSFFSILHRISSLFSIIFLFILIFFLVFTINIHFFDLLIFGKLKYYFLLFIFSFIYKITFFHLLNGLKMLFFNFNFLKTNFILNIINIFILCFFLFHIIFY